MPTPSSCCPFCLKTISLIHYGNHIIKKHKEEVFSPVLPRCQINRRRLQDDSYGNKRAIPLDLGKEDKALRTYWCFGCNGCFKHAARAEAHFKEGHRCYHQQKIGLQELLDSMENPDRKESLMPDVVRSIQECIWVLYDQLDQESRQRADLEKKYEPEYYVERKPFRLETIWSKITKKIPFSIKYDYLKAKFDEEEEQEETPPEPEAEAVPEPVAEPVEEPVVNSIVELKVRRKKPTVKKEEELPPSAPAPPPAPAAETPKETEVDALKRLLSEFPVELQNAALSLRPDLQKKITPPPAPAPVPPPAPTSFSLYAPFSSQTQSPPVLKTTIKRQPKQVTF